MKTLVLAISMTISAQAFSFGGFGSVGSVNLNGASKVVKERVKTKAKEKKRAVASKKKQSYLDNLRSKFN